jgi:hypothetical protein
MQQGKLIKKNWGSKLPIIALDLARYMMPTVAWTFFSILKLWSDLAKKEKTIIVKI